MGSILITQEGVETNSIEVDSRDKSFFNFYTMLEKALKFGDCCFMTEATYKHSYSYGDYYPAFVNLNWEDFQKIKSLKGISFNTYNYITNNFLYIYPKPLTAEKDFEKLNEPRGKGGFKYSNCPEDFLCCISRWNKWHSEYLTTHPKEIQWKSNSHLSNIEAVYDILKEEVLIYIKGKYKEHINKANDTEQEIKKIWNELFADKKYHKKQNGIALFFHQVVMPSKGHNEMTAYCKKIGKKVCEQNYYQYENELSTNEQQVCGSLREIYSIINKKGEKQYISLDFHKGMFEFHDKKGKHLGEYLFDGTFNKKAEESHNLRTL
ncbi:hypothetical protein [Capnocytophaga gingivalis]|uniref:hypothetical protein n=1 Tax=Capnocytophaga gingivalis TaxID=1017 RepID=UPI0028EBBA9C|nr:hypothetical protein [Capnocytophaga gingivalis]